MSFSLINDQNIESNTVLPLIGFKFSPSNNTLFQKFLLPKITNGYYQPGIIHELNVYQYQPWDLPGMDMEECEAYYFTPRSKKHLNGKRPNRIITDHKGFWKMSSTMDIRSEDGILLGKKNLLNYFNSFRVKTEWKMHEYVLDASLIPSESDGSVVSDEVVLCRIYARDNRSRLRGQGRTQMLQSNSSEGLDQQINSIVETSEQRPLKRKQPAAFSNQKEQEQCNQRILGLGAASMTPVEQEQLSAGHPLITQVRQRVPFAPERDADPTQLPSLSSYDQQEQYNEQTLYAELLRPVERTQPLIHHSVPLITQIRRQAPLATDSQTQQSLSSSYDQLKQFNKRALFAEPLTNQPLPSGYVQLEQFNMRVLAAVTMTPVKQEQPLFDRAVPALITHVKQQVSLVAEPSIQLPLLSSYNDQQELSNYKQALVAEPAVTPVQQPSIDHLLNTAEPLMQPVGQLPLPLVQAEVLSQELLSDHDDLNYSDSDSEISFLDNFNDVYDQFMNLFWRDQDL